MMTTCPPTNYETCTLVIQRSAPGVFMVDEYHRHSGDRSYCGRQDTYTNLTWDEAVELLGTLADARRPGMHPEGWEQGRFPI